jgi:RNA polymerase sigma factor (sigma-70 family)
MPEINDQDLIRDYVERHSERAFAELVDQHIHLVYSVAFRYVGNSADAEDVTQAVFVILARKAASLRQRATVTGWLYETTRFTAAALLRSRARQQIREQKAYMQSTLNDPEASEVWQQLAPVLEEGMGRLNEKERTLLALRLLENKTAAETAALLGIREEAAYKRMARALEKLRRFFLQRGIDSSTTLIAESILANSIQPPPAVLAKFVVAAAMVKGATAGVSTLTFIKGALKIMAWSKTKTAIVAGVVVLLAAGVGAVAIEHIQMRRHESKPQSHLIRLSSPVIKVSPNGSIRVLPAGTVVGFGQSTNSSSPYGHAVSAVSFSFARGSSRDAVIGQLEQMHAVILEDSPEHVRAEQEKTSTMKKNPPEMDLSFTNGKLARLTLVLSKANAQ